MWNETPVQVRCMIQDNIPLQGRQGSRGCIPGSPGAPFSSHPSNLAPACSLQGPGWKVLHSLKDDPFLDPRATVMLRRRRKETAAVETFILPWRSSCRRRGSLVGVFILGWVMVQYYVLYFLARLVPALATESSLQVSLVPLAVPLAFCSCSPALGLCSP